MDSLCDLKDLFLPRHTTVDRKGIQGYRIAQNFGGVKLWQIDQFRVLAGEMLVNMEFGGVKYWQMMFSSPNSPKFSLSKFCAIWY